MWTIAVGNPFDGLELHGTFDTAEDANTQADLDYKDMEWNVVEILP